MTLTEVQASVRGVLRKAQPATPSLWDLPASTIHVSAQGDPPSLSVADFFTGQYLPYVKSYKRSWDTDD